MLHTPCIGNQYFETRTVVEVLEDFVTLVLGYFAVDCCHPEMLCQRGCNPMQCASEGDKHQYLFVALLDHFTDDVDTRFAVDKL